MDYVDLHRADSWLIDECAALLHASFLDHPSGWPDLDSAHAEVVDSLSPGKISRVAIDDDGNVAGWIGAQPEYDGNVWELHPLVVRERDRRQGLGRILVQDLEHILALRGALTLWLGTDDEAGETSLAGADLYADLPTQLRAFQAGSHASAFYIKLGFRVVGVMPDANGRGKPDILMAKQLG